MKIERNPFRDYTAESALFVRRALVAFLVILVLSGILIANLYNLQVVRVEDYRTRSNENRIKLVPIAPSRGIIYDRNGTPLALNRTIYQLELMPEKVDDLKATLQALRPVVDLTDDDITNFEKERKRSRRFVSIPVKTALTEVQVARFAVNQFRFPGVEVKGYQRRYYPYGSALTHVTGYVSKINDRDVERLDKDGKLANYAATHDIGKLGIERYYEDTLHGKTGYEEVEVNNRGRVIRQLHEQPPSAGQDVYLTLDLNLQRYIEQLLVGSRAAVVVSDPRTGAILAMVSNPSYDPNLFVDGISSKDYQGLLNDPNRPLINRVYCAMLMGVGLQMMIANPFDEKQNDVIRWIETKDTSNPLARLYNKIAERTSAMEEPQMEDFDLSDPEQSAIWKTIQILLNKVIYADSYLMN